MHLKRWITGLSALPFLIYFIYQGGILFTLLVSVACLFSLWEYFRIVFANPRKALTEPICLLGYFVGILMIWAAEKGTGHLAGILAGNLVLAALISLFQFKKNPGILETVKKQIVGVVYIPLLLSLLVTLRYETAGMIWIFTLLAIVFAGDISALYFGTYLGRHKLAAAVSPGKTIEGSIGGLTANLITGSVAKYYFFPELAWGPCLIFFVLIGIAGQAGDLFESEFKRTSNVKDSGGLLPGHGGFMDRIDALLFAAPVAYIFIMYIF